MVEIDPEITYQASKLLSNEKYLSLKEFFFEFFATIYNTHDQAQQKHLFSRDYEIAKPQVLNAFTDDLKPIYSDMNSCIHFLFSPQYNPDQEQIARTFSMVMRNRHDIEPIVLFEFIKQRLPPAKAPEEIIGNMLADKLNKPTTAFRYPSDHYEQRPVFKATGGKLKQYITDGFTGNSERQEWGYFKGMPNAFFVEVEGNSMTGSGIKDKDYCLINPHASLGDGDICLAINGNTEATIKKFKKTTQGIMLTPSNPDFEPIFIPAPDAEHWHFYKVIESRHKF